jgi:hypothetical protein
MTRKFVRYRGFSPTPYSESESESDSTTQIIVRKTVTKEKRSNWGWGRASQASNVSSITEPPRSASPTRVAYHRESSRHRHRRHRSRHEFYHHHESYRHEHPRALDHHQDEPRRSRRHRRRYSEDAPLSPPPPPPPREEEKDPVHKRCHYHICPSPILLAVPIKPSRKMEEVGGFTYEEWCKRRECVPVPTETIAPKSSISNRSTQTQARTHSEVSDQDNAYRYVAMREPGPQDAVVSFLIDEEIFCAVQLTFYNLACCLCTLSSAWLHLHVAASTIRCHGCSSSCCACSSCSCSLFTLQTGGISLPSLRPRART